MSCSKCARPTLCRRHLLRSLIKMHAYKREMRYMPTRTQAYAWIAIRANNPELTERYHR